MLSADSDLRLAELLTSRLCHDLVGPISAIGNGMELLEEGMSELDEEAKRLVSDSAGQAGAALQFFRVAFGFGSNPADDPGEVRSLIERFVGHRKTSLAWPESFPQALCLAGRGKLLLNMAALAVEALPFGGRIEVAADAAAGRLTCRSIGSDAGLRPEVAASLAPDATVEGLTPRTVQGFYAMRVADRLGARLEVAAEAPDRFAVSALLPG